MDIKEEILKMTQSQRISLVQDIWDSLSEDSIDLSDPIKEELDNRLKLHNDGKMDYLSLDEVREAMAKRK
jgi:putative addiction module component (TIGR02574 family)